MSSRIRSLPRAVLRRFRGVRARLVVAFLLIATLAAAAGVIIFALLLSRTLRDNADTSLRATADSFATEIQTGAFENTDGRPAVDPRRAGGDNLTIVSVYAPNGQLVEAEPAVLAANPRGLATSEGFATARYDGRQFRLLRESVSTTSGTWTVVVGQSVSAIDDASSDALSVLYVIVPIAVVLSAAGAWLLSGAALRPVERMRQDAQLLSETGAPGGVRVPDTGDSLNRLGQTFNVLLQRLHDSLQRQRDFVADAGHELRTPLAVLQTELETAVRPGRTRADLEDSIAHARSETARLAALAEDLLLLAQADGPSPVVRPELVEPLDIVNQSLDAHREHFASAGVWLTGPDVRTAVVADVDPVALRRILDNLLGNALRYTPPQGSVSVACTAKDDGLALVVEDSGVGFPNDFLPHAFERFLRADRSRSRSSASTGSGLGLSIVATLVEAHGGSVTAENVEPTGARITVRFPLSVPAEPL